jgi:hypothetical protein
MFKRIVKKWLMALFDRPLPPPSSDERTAISELQMTFRNLPLFDTTNKLPSESEWLSNMNRLRELVISQSPRDFLRWDVVASTMFVSYAAYISKELSYLKHHPDWDTRWKPAIAESQVGHPVRYFLYPASSCNLIHHAYHVAQFEEKTKIKIHEMDFAFEFGGGYGSMCRLFHNLGFKGRYLIFDLPSFSALQIYYLKSIGLPVQTVDEFDKSPSGITCISASEQLEATLKGRIQTRNKMCIATWSISESPIRIRDLVLPLTSDFQSFLIAYQDNFGEVDNLEFFNNWKKTLRHVDWHGSQIAHLPGNSYLFGSVSPDV